MMNCRTRLSLTFNNFAASWVVTYPVMAADSSTKLLLTQALIFRLQIAERRGIKGAVMAEAVNTHDQLRKAGGGVAIVPTYTGTRTQWPYGWGIYRIDANGQHIVTDPKAHWSNYGKKVFSHSNHQGTPAERKRASLEQAKRWVAEQGWYDGEWKCNRMRDYVPAEINKRFPLSK
jgi:hypothetical protein